NHDPCHSPAEITPNCARPSPSTWENRMESSHCGSLIKWARNRQDPDDFDAAVRAIADQLGRSRQLVNYQRRRTALADWCLSPDDWTHILLETNCKFRVDLGDRERQFASIIVWTQVTCGEFAFAPRPIRDQQAAQIQRGAWRGRPAPRGWPFHLTSPESASPKYLVLRQVLDAYANELAVRVDEGAVVPNGSAT
ncbi:hypothetical protein, partial [Nonomuraea sp. NPDC049400]|uniref:hypothetical protein n=1 Tax=Nonomuraea sp. NPDC049400 TaxID=3364352 RepID=UPI00378749F6